VRFNQDDNFEHCHGKQENHINIYPSFACQSLVLFISNIDKSGGSGGTTQTQVGTCGSLPSLPCAVMEWRSEMTAMIMVRVKERKRRLWLEWRSDVHG
jgi:hypothetical protein